MRLIFSKLVLSGLLRENVEHETARKTIVRLLGHKDGVGQKRVLNRLSTIGELGPGGNVIVPHLLPFLATGDTELRRDVLSILSGTSVQFEEVFPNILPLFKDKDDFVRWQAIEVLHTAKRQRRHSKFVLPILIDALSDSEWRAGAVARRILIEMKSDAMPAVKTLVGQLDVEVDRPGVMIEIAQTILFIDPQNNAAIEAIRRELQCNEIGRQISALDRLERLDVVSVNLGKDLAQLQLSDDRGIRERADKVMKKIK